MSGGILGIKPDGLSKAVITLRSQAVRLDAASDMAQSALFMSDLQSPVVGRLRDRADHFRRVADELQVRIDIVRAFEIDPGAIDPELAAAAMRVGLDSVSTLAELNHRIDNWAGTDDDPLLDELIAQRAGLISDLFGDAVPVDGTQVDPFVAAVAEQNNLSYREAELVVLSVEVEDLTRQIGLQFDATDPSERERLVGLRADALASLLEGDADLIAIVAQQLDRGTELFDSVTVSVHEVYGDASIAELQDAISTHGGEDSFGLAVFDLFDLHDVAIAEFTGVDTALVNPRLAAVAQAEGLAYNALVDQYNAAIDAGDFDGEHLDHIAINATIPNDATLVWNLSQQDLFEELETALQGDRSMYDGQLSNSDLNTILANPEDFSQAAVAAAQALADNDELRLRIDTAGSGQFLDGLANGTHNTDGHDGLISMSDVQQHVTNSIVYDLLQPLAGDLDTDSDGRITKAEFEAELATIDPDGQLAAVIDYALSAEAFHDRDRRSTMQKIGDGAWTFTRLATGTASLDERVSFARGLLWEFPKGLATLAYDASSLVPGSPAYFIEAHTDWGGEGHRGVALLTGLKDAAEVGLTLVPGTPQYNAEMERLRRSGRYSDHAGLGLITTIADWETFVDDPAQWFGTITGDIFLTAATGGYGAIAKGGSVVRATSRFTARLDNVRHLTNLDNLRHIRTATGTRLRAALANTRQAAAHARTWLNEPVDIRDWLNSQLDHIADGLNTTLNGGIPPLRLVTDGPSGQGRVADNLVTLMSQLDPRQHPMWEDLSWDAAHKGRNKKSEREAEVAIRAEQEELVPRIAGSDPTGAGEFIDVDDRVWDVKNFPSRYIGLEDSVKKIRSEIDLGENILIDTQGMTPAHIEGLRAAIEAEKWTDRVKILEES